MRSQSIELRGRDFYARVAPQICAVSTMLAQFDVVSVLGFSVFEDENQLVLAAVEAALAPTFFGPHNEIDLGIKRFGGRLQLIYVPPVHTPEMNRPRSARHDKISDCLAKKIRIR